MNITRKATLEILTDSIKKFHRLFNMHPKDPEILLADTWKIVRKRFFYPECPEPKILEFSSSWPAMRIKKRRILINARFLNNHNHTIPVSDMLEVILTHGLAHHAVCPWDLRTHVLLFSEAAKTIQDPSYARFVTDLFLDIVVDYHCFLHRWDKTHHILKAIGPRNPHLEVKLSIYSIAWNIASVPADTVLSKTTIEYLADIDYLDKSRWFRNIRKFTRALRANLPRLLPTGSTLPEPLMGFHDMETFGSTEFSESFRTLAQDLENPATFASIFSKVKDAYGQSQNGDSKRQMGRGLGYETKVNPFFYMSLAEKYRMQVRKRDIRKDGSLYPFSHEKWSVSDPFYDIDIWNSMGRILPTITVKWKKREGEIHCYQEKVPDCMILIDSSGSMPNPSQKLSYAVLGASCAADAYLREGSRVSVYNFSDAPAGNKKLLLNSRNRMEIYEALCTYFGGGTAIEVRLLAEVINDKELDIFLITDMEITNLEHLIRLFTSLEKVRVTAVYIGEKKGVERFQQAARKMKNVSVYGIKEPKDIMKIVLGQIRKYIHSK